MYPLAAINWDASYIANNGVAGAIAIVGAALAIVAGKSAGRAIGGAISRVATPPRLFWISTIASEIAFPLSTLSLAFAVGLHGYGRWSTLCVWGYFCFQIAVRCKIMLDYRLAVAAIQITDAVAKGIVAHTSRANPGAPVEYILPPEVEEQRRRMLRWANWFLFSTLFWVAVGGWLATPFRL
jgi:hypothetical protein